MRTRFLEVCLGKRLVGFLGEVDNVVRFCGAPEYVADANRPTLSLSYGPITQDSLIRDTLVRPFSAQNQGAGGRLPTFFSNLLPEGALRDKLAQQRGTSVNAEFDLLAAAGDNLPGNVRVRPALEVPKEIRDQLITENQDNVEVTVVDDPIEGAASLSGVQRKAALSMERSGKRFTLMGHSDGIAVVAKFAPIDHPDMVRNEFVCTQLAALAGAATIDCNVYPLSALDEASRAGWTLSGTEFLASPRFDYGPDGRVHVEDLCQVLNRLPGGKYGSVKDFVQCGQVLHDCTREPARELSELLRRFVINAMIANCDAHLKNTMFLYRDARSPELSPAYDLLCVAPDAQKGQLKINLAIDEFQRGQGFDDFMQIADEIGLSHRIASAVITDVVNKARTNWPERLNKSDVPPRVRECITERLKSLRIAREAQKHEKLPNRLRVSARGG